MSTQNLTKASNEWLKRPEQERYEDLQSIIETDHHRMVRSHVDTQETKDLKVVEAGQFEGIASPDADLTNGLDLLTANGRHRLNSWSFEQAARMAGAPAGYLKKLPAHMVADLMSHGFRKGLGVEAGLPANSGALITDGVVAGLMSAAYDRIWSWEVARWLRDAAPDFINPWARAITWTGEQVADGVPFDPNDPRMSYLINIQPGELVSPSGLYLSDRDFFAFMISPDVDFDDDTGNTYRKGFFAWNSHVGAGTAGIDLFHFSDVCGNHIVWGAENLLTLETRHSKGARERWERITREAVTILNSNGRDYQEMIRKAKDIRVETGEDPEDYLHNIDLMLRKARVSVPKSIVNEAVDIAATEKYGDPTTVWALTNGMTQASQGLPYAADRTKVDRAAGKLLTAATK